MKISKVDNTRLAVIEDDKRQSAASGILYYNPDKDGEKINLGDRVENTLNKNAQRLYSILNANDKFDFIEKGNREEENFCRNANKNFGCLIQALAVQNSKTQINFLKNLPNQTIKKRKKEKDSKVYFEESSTEKLGVSSKLSAERQQELITSMVRANARKSFCKSVGEVDLLKVTDKILWAMCCVKEKDLFKQEMNNVNDEELQVFFEQLNRDYTKKDQLERIVGSIESQNVKVQPKRIHTKDGIEMKGLALSNAEHKRKKYIFQFIIDFANGNEEEKQELFRYFKRLVVLFYLGSKKYEELKDEEISDWGFKLQGLDNNMCYSVEIMKKADEKRNCPNKLIQKEINLQIKEMLKARLHESYNDGNQYLKDKYPNHEKEDSRDHEEYEKASYWLSYIKEKAEQLLEGKTSKANAFSVTDLCERTWEEWISFICMKYIDMGKGVYHFAMPELEQVGTRQNTIIGGVEEQYQNGLTSFDYEKIKAYESFDREVATYITFAVNNFSTAVQDEKSHCEDVLNPDNKLILHTDLVKRVLWFFGGKSSWGNIDEYKEDSFFEVFKQELSAIRNASFHYTAVQGEVKSDELIRTMFEKEYGETGMVIRKKYFSNNVPMFYPVEKINELMNHLYHSSQERPAQIPSFDKVLKRKDFADFIDQYLSDEGRKNRNAMSLDNTKILYSAMYFLLKEIYYHGFLQEKELTQMFRNSVYAYQREMARQAETNPRDKEQAVLKRAADSFVNRLKDSRKNVCFGELCQQIMTDYNMQNNREMKVKISLFHSENDKKSYEHFPLILRRCIQEAFAEYLFKNGKFKGVYGFLGTPEDRTEYFKGLDEKKFCGNWETHMYDKMKKNADSAALAWYALAHFLNQRQLNHMIGTFRSHIQFLEDISRRYQNTHKPKTGMDRENSEASRIEKYKKITEVLEFVLLFCGQMTNNLEDYFKGNKENKEQGKEEYAKHLAKYVAFESEYLKGAAALQDFCERTVEEGSAVYYDAKNPILNKNIIKTMMYGNAELLEACVEPVTEKEIRDYYQMRNELADVFKKKQTLYKEEQEKLRQFQDKKNRVELTNVTVYMEILDELMGQLISWAYLRERDLMYFQLGYYYMKFYYGDSIPSGDKRRSLKGEGFSIADGAILYQIAAMYSYHLPVYTVDAHDTAKLPEKKKGNGIGGGVPVFAGTYGDNAYLEGLQLFTKRKELKTADNELGENVQFRNYLDHFKYFSNLDRSMMDLYSVMFDRFFAYSTKLHKSVPIVLKNILAKYFVIADTDLNSKKMRCFRQKSGKEKGKEAIRNTAAIVLRDGRKKYAVNAEDNANVPKLQSDCFTYKVKDRRYYTDKNGKQREKTVDDTVKLDARSESFLRELENILEYSLK